MTRLPPFDFQASAGARLSAHDLAVVRDPDDEDEQGPFATVEAAVEGVAAWLAPGPEIVASGARS